MSKPAFFVHMLINQLRMSTSCRCLVTHLVTHLVTNLVTNQLSTYTCYLYAHMRNEVVMQLPLPPRPTPPPAVPAGRPRPPPTFSIPIPLPNMQTHRHDSQTAVPCIVRVSFVCMSLSYQHDRTSKLLCNAPRLVALSFYRFVMSSFFF